MAVMALLLDQDRCTKNFNIYWDRTGTNEWMLVSPGRLGQLLGISAWNLILAWPSVSSRPRKGLLQALSQNRQVLMHGSAAGLRKACCKHLAKQFFCRAQTSIDAWVAPSSLYKHMFCSFCIDKMNWLL